MIKYLPELCENLDSRRIPITEADRKPGNIPYYGASGIVDFVEGYIFDEDLLLVSEDGANLIMRSSPIAFTIHGKAWINNHAHVLRFHDAWLRQYVELYLNSISLEPYVTGSAQPKLNQKKLNEIPIPIPEETKIRQVVDSVSIVHRMISMRKQQLAKLDELVKARFVEMFGTPEHNEKAIRTLPMTELCEIIDGDRGTNYPKQEEFFDNGFCLFLNAKNVTASGFSFENCMFITAEKDKLLRKGKLSRGDVVLTTRGTLGNLAFYDDTVPYEHIRINSGMVILRMKRDSITERFFIEQFKMQLASIKEKIASGSAQPQLPISTMNKIVLLVPDIEKQERFATFVGQLDKSKLEIQTALTKLETLKKALMQQYFG